MPTEPRFYEDYCFDTGMLAGLLTFGRLDIVRYVCGNESICWPDGSDFSKSPCDSIGIDSLVVVVYID